MSNPFRLWACFSYCILRPKLATLGFVKPPITGILLSTVRAVPVANPAILAGPGGDVDWLEIPASREVLLTVKQEMADRRHNIYIYTSQLLGLRTQQGGPR